MHIKRRRSSEASLTASTIYFICNVAQFNADVWGVVNAPLEAVMAGWPNSFIRGKYSTLSTLLPLVSQFGPVAPSHP